MSLSAAKANAVLEPKHIQSGIEASRLTQRLFKELQRQTPDVLYKAFYEVFIQHFEDWEAKFKTLHEEFVAGGWFPQLSESPGEAAAPSPKEAPPALPQVISVSLEGLAPLEIVIVLYTAATRVRRNGKPNLNREWLQSVTEIHKRLCEKNLSGGLTLETFAGYAEQAHKNSFLRISGRWEEQIYVPASKAYQVGESIRDKFPDHTWIRTVDEVFGKSS